MFNVSCPNCAATYSLDEAKVGPAGRKLKCAKCAQVWTAFAPGREPVVEVAAPVATAPAVEQAVAEAKAEEVAAQIVAAAEKLDAPAMGDEALADFTLPDLENLAGVGRQGIFRIFVGGEKWVALALVLCVVGILAGLWVLFVPETKVADAEMDAPVVRAQDVMAREMTTPPAGLVLRDVKADFSTGEKEGVVFGVKGTLENTSHDAMMLPGLQVELVDKTGAVADVWPVKLERASLAAGGALTWEVSFTNPPVDDMAGWRAVFVK